MATIDKLDGVLDRVMKAAEAGQVQEALSICIKEWLPASRAVLTELEEGQAKKHAYVEGLEAKIARLQAENAQLRAELNKVKK